MLLAQAPLVVGKDRIPFGLLDTWKNPLAHIPVLRNTRLLILCSYSCATEYCLLIRSTVAVHKHYYYYYDNSGSSSSSSSSSRNLLRDVLDLGCLLDVLHDLRCLLHVLHERGLLLDVLHQRGLLLDVLNSLL